MRRIILLTLGLIMSLGVLVYLTRLQPSSPPASWSASSRPSSNTAAPAAATRPGPTDESLVREAHAAMDRGLAWLLAHQADDGHWSQAEFPALTALPLWALAQAEGYDEAKRKAVNYLLTCVHPDGSIFREPREERKGGGLANYNTALAMVALHALGDPDLMPVVQSARAFVAGTQHLGNDIYRGGMGYDPETGRAYADLSNSYIAYEAMRLTESAGDWVQDREAYPDLDWEAAAGFIARVQNRPESNDQPWASDAPDEYGGFAYRPDASQAGVYTNDEGVVRLRSYGSMTYAGLLSFIYAQVDRTDPRVQSAAAWAAKFWTLEENPGMGAEGLFYYYNVLAKALAVYGEDTLELPDGRRIPWRTELLRKLVNLQRIDPETGHGYWVNDEGRWWEADPVLVTAYTVLALQVALRE